MSIERDDEFHQNARSHAKNLRGSVVAQALLDSIPYAWYKKAHANIRRKTVQILRLNALLNHAMGLLCKHCAAGFVRIDNEYHELSEGVMAPCGAEPLLRFERERYSQHRGGK